MEYQNLKWSEMKDLLAKRGLPSHGKKNVLLQRLLEYEQKIAKNSMNHSTNTSNLNTNSTINTNTDNISLKSVTEITQSQSSDIKDSQKNSNQINNHSELTRTEPEHLYNTMGKQSNALGRMDDSKVHLIKGNIQGINKNESMQATKQHLKSYETQSKDMIMNHMKKPLTTNYGEDSEPKSTNIVNRNNTNEENQRTIGKVTIQPITFSEKDLSTSNNLENNTIIKEKICELTEKEKRELRKKRFGEIMSKNDAFESRAKRFKVVTNSTIEEEKKKRAERFGLPQNNINKDADIKKKRAERFGMTTEEDKMKARAIRFGLPR